MGKESKSKLDDRLIEQMLQEDRKIRSEREIFYPADSLANFTFVAGQTLPPPLISRVKAEPNSQAPEQELLREVCQKTRDNVQLGKPGSVEIQLNKGRQMSDKRVFPLGNTVIKFLPSNASEPIYLFLKAEDTLDASVFLEDNNASGIMLIKDESGDDFFFILSEFHMLSIAANPDPRKEVGLMTSYTIMAPKVYSSIVYGFSLDPIKNLLFSEWLLMQWQQAQDAASQSSDEETGGEPNG